MTKICEQMNMRNRMARYASRASSDYHTYQYFRDRNNVEQAIITAIEEDSVTLMLIKYGLECKVPLTAVQAAQTKKLNEGKGIFYRV
jgi:exosome complex exonuclease DIS3/RRP44